MIWFKWEKNSLYLNFHVLLCCWGYDLVWFSFADNSDYSVLTNLNFAIEPTSFRRHCIALSILQDEIGEGMEQFEFYFENLPNEAAGVGTPATTCVNIIDDDGE